MEVSLCWQNTYKGPLEGQYKETVLDFSSDGNNTHL